MSARDRAVCALLVAGALLSAPQVGRAAPPDLASLTDADVLVLRRVGELQAWARRPVALESAVCVQERMGTRWPAGGLDGLEESRESAVRMALEQCEAQQSGGAEGTRIVPRGYRGASGAAAALAGPRLVLGACAAAGQSQPFRQCVETRLGRPVSDGEGRLLLAAVGASR
ncbi:MAG: hypothetical protein MZW92_57325 [Comamonadaceae bacterium]|nr:hypothetical protein [Comamonadaceae bacterium]